MKVDNDNSTSLVTIPINSYFFFIIYAKNVNKDHEIRSLVLIWMKECTIFVLNRVSDWRPRKSGSPGAHLYSNFPWMPPTQALSLLPFPFLSPSLLVFTHFLFFILGSLRCHNSNGNQNLKKINRLNRQNNNSAHAACFYVHFFSVFARLRWWKYLVSRFTDLTGMNDDRIFFLFLNLDMIGRNSASE